MIQTYSHTFTFQTGTEKERLENIISITEEEEKKHYLQFMQYKTDDNSLMSYRQVNIKVDRAYYLEIANIAIDDRLRRRKIFTLLGKRRFGFSDRLIDTYFISKDLHQQDVLEGYKAIKKEHYDPIIFEKVVHNLNKYEAFAFEVKNRYFVHMFQANVSKRKTIHKIFLVELTEIGYLFLNSLDSSEQKIDYIFNKIGKIYFKSLNEERLQIDNSVAKLEESVKTVISKNPYELELSSNMNDSKLFHELRDNSIMIEKAYFNLYGRGVDLVSQLDKEQSITLFSAAIVALINQLKNISQLDEIRSYFDEIYMLAEDGKLHGLFKKHDQDLKDIFLYVLECLTDWNSHLNSAEKNIRKFNIATIDLQNSLKHLIDTYFKFNHEYNCQDAKITKELVYKKDEDNLHYTSAIEYLEDAEIDSEFYDELIELESEVIDLAYLSDFDDEVRQKLVRFFSGYSRTLNSLFEFKDLGYSLSLLSKQLSTAVIDERRCDKLLVFVKAFIADLLEWKNSIFIEKSAENIHYIDKSFYSNIAQLEHLLSDQFDESALFGDFEMF